jgi:hypothetical protein
MANSIKSPLATQFDQELGSEGIDNIMGSLGETSLQRQQQLHDEVFEKLHGSKVFVRSDPAPFDIDITAKKRLQNNKNSY